MTERMIENRIKKLRELEAQQKELEQLKALMQTGQTFRSDS